VFLNFPLTQIHPHAQQAAEAAGVQKKFWDAGIFPSLIIGHSCLHNTICYYHHLITITGQCA
jgi:hypothetical protein